MLPTQPADRRWGGCHGRRSRPAAPTAGPPLPCEPGLGRGAHRDAAARGPRPGTAGPWPCLRAAAQGGPGPSRGRAPLLGARGGGCSAEVAPAPPGTEPPPADGGGRDARSQAPTRRRARPPRRPRARHPARPPPQPPRRRRRPRPSPQPRARRRRPRARPVTAARARRWLAGTRPPPPPARPTPVTAARAPPFVAGTRPPGAAAPPSRSARGAGGRAALCWRSRPARAAAPPTLTSGQQQQQRRQRRPRGPSAAGPWCRVAAPQPPGRLRAARAAAAAGGGGGGGGARARAPIGPRGRHSPRPARHVRAPPLRPASGQSTSRRSRKARAASAWRLQHLRPHASQAMAALGARVWRTRAVAPRRGRGSRAAPDLRLCEGFSRGRAGGDSVRVEHCPNQAPEKAVATRSVLAWKVPHGRGAWRAAPQVALRRGR